MLETTEKTGKKKHDKSEREDWRTVGELLINPLSFTQLAQSHRGSVFSCCTIAVCDLQIFCSKSTRCWPLEYKQTFFGVVVLVFFTLIPARMRYACFVSLCFRVFSPWQPWQLGTPAKVLPLLLVRQECERQKCERHQCEANSANANSAKGSTVRMRQECECQMCECQQCDATSVRKKCDSSANANSANRIFLFNWFWLDLDGTENGSQRKLECARWHVVPLELTFFQLTFTFNTMASMFVFM